jgi:hypothetical protein
MVCRRTEHERAALAALLRTVPSSNALWGCKCTRGGRAGWHNGGVAYVERLVKETMALLQPKEVKNPIVAISFSFIKQ